MKVKRNGNNNQPLSPAEQEACRQFAESEREGRALFHPRVAAGQPAPNCVLSLEEIGRFAVTIPEGRYTVEGGQWFRYKANDVQAPVRDPLEQAWQAAKSVRTALKRALEINTYVIAVLWFPDMDEDEDILEEADDGSVHLCFGKVDLVQRLADLPKEDELQAHLNGRFIKREVEVLSHAADVKAATPPGHPSLDLGDGRLVIQHVDVVNVYVNAGPDGDASLRDAGDR